MRIAEYVLWQVVSGVGNEEAADGCKLFHTDTAVCTDVGAVPCP